jgi:hypothetical protein
MQLEHGGGLVTEGEEGEENVSVKSRTENGSAGPVEDVSDSEDFSKTKKCYKEDWMILRQNVKS